MTLYEVLISISHLPFTLNVLVTSRRIRRRSLEHQFKSDKTISKRKSKEKGGLVLWLVRASEF
jgi:hypothetical protein